MALPARVDAALVRARDADLVFADAVILATRRGTVS